MNLLLNVPYHEKDLAKQKGAKWNSQIKSWYIDNLSNISNFKKWLPPHNYICENLYILRMEQICYRCKKTTQVVLFATDKSYSSNENYTLNNNIQILTYVKAMPDSLGAYMRTHFAYSPDYSYTIKEKYFVNHCSHCHALQGDNYLHEVPSQAFYKKIFYKNSSPINYAKINHTFYIPLLAEPPYYDDTAASFTLLDHHMKTGRENRASLIVTQKKINGLFDCSIKDPDIQINGI